MTLTLQARVYALGLQTEPWRIGATMVTHLLDPGLFLAVNGSLPVTRDALAALREYSTSLPTGTAEGKVWKRRTVAGWYLGRYGAPFPHGHALHGQTPIEWWPILVLGEPARWPADVPVQTAPMRGRAVAVEWPPPASESELPEGLFERDGRVWFECLACGHAVELPVEEHEFDPDMAYCGGSPRCLP